MGCGDGNAIAGVPKGGNHRLIMLALGGPPYGGRVGASGPSALGSSRIRGGRALILLSLES
jgi:hypothetical protein